MEKRAKYYLFEEMTIIAAEDQKQAEGLYEKEYDDGYEKVEEIQGDYIVGGTRSGDGLGYDEVYLSEIVENQSLPYVVDVDIL